MTYRAPPPYLASSRRARSLSFPKRSLSIKKQQTKKHEVTSKVKEKSEKYIRVKNDILLYYTSAQRSLRYYIRVKARGRFRGYKLRFGVRISVIYNLLICKTLKRTIVPFSLFTRALGYKKIRLFPEKSKSEKSAICFFYNKLNSFSNLSFIT